MDDHKIVPAVEPDRQLHPLVEAAMRAPGGLSPENLDKLLDLQAKYLAQAARQAYTTAIVGLHRDLPASIARDKVVDFGSAKGRTHYTHASLAALTRGVTGPLCAHGFAMYWIPSTDPGGKITVTCRLTHAMGHYEECTLSSQPDTSGSKGPAQAIASTITLLERYTGFALLGLATEDMPEPHQEELPATAQLADPDRIDPTINIAAAKYLTEHIGGTYEAEELVGRSVKDWRSSDLAEIREWAKARIQEEK